MRSILFALVIGMVAVPAFAQQSAPKAKTAKLQRCTPAWCMNNAKNKGFDVSTGANWCASHNNGC